MDVTTLAARLREAADHHHAFERSGPAHDWSDWYAAFVLAREGGATAEESSARAARHVEQVLTSGEGAGAPS